MRFVSPIADGADQIAAEVALDLGWELQAIVPFGRDAYRASLANHAAREGSTICSREPPACSNFRATRRMGSTLM